MKKIFFLLTFFLCVFFTGCSSDNSPSISNSNKEEYQKIQLVMAVNGTDTQIDSKVANKFADLVSEASNGNVTISVYPNDQLASGNATKGIEMLAVGAVDLAAYATSVMAVLDEKIGIATIPYTFSNYTEAKQVIDTSGGKYYEKLLADKGITYLGSFHNGFRQISNNKHEVRTPEDVKGLKIRVPGGEVYMDFFNTLGADPIAMSWSEVFTAVQQGTIDGQENGVSITKSAKMNEVQKYITIWNYSYENDLFVANSKIWNTLEPKTQQLLREKAKEACNWGRQQVENEEDGIIAEFEEDAIIVTKLTPEELNTFKNAVEPVREKFINKYGKENYNAFINK